MNIQEAKQEIIHTLQAYLRKDDAGNYLFPAVHQRPILLMGPPGIGKTAIMEQVARRCGVGLVAYTITHHTRQSAIGLPHIEEKTYGGQVMSVTEYTMSEIIASVYETIERTGCQEGILFLDEINCVSETLAPTMRDHGAYRLSGGHPVPGRDQLRFGDAGAHHAAISAEQDLRHAPCPGGLGHRGRGKSAGV